MSFKEIDLKRKYDSDEDDVLNEFYIPVLKKAKLYRRLAGFYSSTALAVASKGVLELIKNGGKMQMVVGARLSPADVDEIRKGSTDRESVILRSFNEEIDGITDEVLLGYVKSLAWLISHDRLVLKIAILLDDDGFPLDYTNIGVQGIYHMKIGIFTDQEDNIISFSGSINETALGWIKNIEGFHVFKSWLNERDHIDEDIDTFNKFWYNKAFKTLVIDAPYAVKQKLISIAPVDIEEIEKLIKIQKDNGIRIPELIKIRPYQLEAIQNWFGNEKSGIFEMATGTGKTITALSAAVKCIKENNELVVVITCPFKHLVDQWKKVSITFGFIPLLCYESKSKWLDKLYSSINEYILNLKNVIFIITTYDTMITDDFQNALKKIDTNFLFIADEVHHLGSLETRKKLFTNANYRLGLSATPQRWYDDIGTQVIYDYFKGVVYSFSLNNAIRDGYLVPYEYHPIIITLTNEEISRYRELSLKIARMWHIVKGDTGDDKLQNLLIRRSRILNNATNKIPQMLELLRHFPIIQYLLIYCDPSQINVVMKNLIDMGIVCHRFTAREPNKDRQYILSQFENKRYQAIVAMYCLDEGVDVPPTRTAIILASSGNPRQFIQRRGRILRLHKGKVNAIIYDFVTMPPTPSFAQKTDLEVERKIIEKELKRVNEFAGSAINEFEARSKILEHINKFGMVTF